LLLLVDVEWEADATEIVLSHLEACLATPLDDADLQAEVYAAVVNCTTAPAPKRALEHAKAAERLLSEEREPEFLASVLLNRFWAEAMLGRTPRRELLERGLEVEAKASPKHHVPLLWFVSTDEFDAARARQAVEDEWRRERGHERLRADRLAYLAVVELRAGRWVAAEECAARSTAMIEHRETGALAWTAFGWRSFVDAHRGRVARARSTLLPLIEEADRTATGRLTERLLSVQGFVEFAAGNHDAADRALTRMRERYDSIGATEPLLDWSEPFHIESLVALGELERARQTLARLEERGRRFPRLWIDVTLPRARALVLAAEGDPAAALAALDELDAGASAKLPFELGWALLVKGRLLRRVKQRRAAAESLREALDIFERLGAPAWAEQARSDLARAGPRRRAPDELTATELRVAELAAAGLTNREVAKEAFISAKTVEANLARVYHKLGIRSRAELGARMADRVGSAEPKT
jgi:DNA-binding NarL/FixJ family response regulator